MRLAQATNILVIRLSSLGDILLTTPVLRSLRKLNSFAKISFLVKENFIDSVRYNPNIDKVIEYKGNESLDDLIRELREKNFDFVIDLHNNWRSRKITKAIAAPSYCYRKPTFKKIVLVHFGINLYKKIVSIPELYVKNMDEIRLDEKGLEIFLPDETNRLRTDQKNSIGLCVGAKHYTKRWLPEYFVTLGNKLVELEYTINIFGGSDDKGLCEEIASQIKGAVNLSNNDDLIKLASDMKKCKLIICNDSGLMHLATALGIPVAVFFGSSVKELGFSPYKTSNLVLENNLLSCRPCSHIGRDKCPKKHFDCMKSITPAIVIEELKTFITTI